ncbi:MAG: transposase [Ignavibacteria bacterium]
MTYYHRNLPHYQPDGATFFITFRLSGSIPLIKLYSLRTDYEKELKELTSSFSAYKSGFYDKLYVLQKKHFAKFDNLIDSNLVGPDWLKIDDVAKIVSDKIHSFDNSKYELIVYCIMPNHVHLVIKLYEDLVTSKSNFKGKTKEYILADILRLIKGSTARNSNILLKRTGSFWQHESYDHVVRNEKELGNIIRYVLNNPVKAGLVNDYKQWKWSY